MKKYLVLLFAYAFAFTVIQAQKGIKLTYATTRSLSTRDLSGHHLSGPTLGLTTHVLYANNKVLSYQTPHYLSDYPDGEVQLTISETNTTSISPLVMDTIQQLRYYNLDSLYFITRADLPKSAMNNRGEIRNNYFRFERGFERWQLLPDSIRIDGRWCKRATLRYSHNNEIVYDFWYTEEIPLPLSPLGYSELPGLVVRGSIPPLGSHFELTAYDMQALLTDADVWKKELDEPYIKKAFIPSAKRQPN